jgi:hypothetical protein
MFTPAFRIPFLILIGWTLLFFIFPMIAMAVMGLGIGALFFGYVLKCLRDGVVAGSRLGSFSFSFERSRQPAMFWLFTLLYFACGIGAVSLAVLGAFRSRHDLLIHYF